MPVFHVVVPVLNEAPNLPRLSAAFAELARQFGAEYDVHFLLIDDGSTDGTADIARQLNAGLHLSIVRHEKNYGPGHAFSSAYQYLADRLADSDWVATLEGDNTSRHELLGQMVTRSREGYDVILASPYAYGGGVQNTNAFRMLLSHVANAFVKGGLGISGIHTMSSFFRLHRGSAIRRLQRVYGPGIIEHSGFDGVVEMLMKMVILRMTISEVPMVLDTSRRIGKSKMKVGRTIVSYLTLFGDKRRWMKAAFVDVTAVPSPNPNR